MAISNVLADEQLGKPVVRRVQYDFDTRHSGSDSVAIAEAVVICDRIQAEIQVMCVLVRRGNRCVVVDTVTGENNPKAQPGS